MVAIRSIIGENWPWIPVFKDRTPATARTAPGRDRTTGEFDVKKATATASVRFWAKVQGNDYTECWIWTAFIHKGYGRFSPSDHCTAVAHRWAWEFIFGPVPDGLQLDHLCHTQDPTCLGGDDCPHRRCVNPWHLEPVSVVVNHERSCSDLRNISKTHCPQGHRYDEANTRHRSRGSRDCRACNRAYRAAKRAEQKAQAA
jgi:hypothetical protein